MHVHKIQFAPSGATEPETVSDLLNGFLGALCMNGQVCGREWPIYSENGRQIAVVLTPEQDSLDARYLGRYPAKYLAEANEAGIAVTSTVVSEDMNGAEVCRCANPSGYILFTTFISLESPARCLDCFGTVPLYRFPTLPSSEYYGAITWQSNYQACDRLQMNCAVLERAATRQISDPRSALSKQGLAVCQQLQEAAGKPFYYYLYRDHGRSAAVEKRRTCPACGGAWYLEERLHSRFDFRCDRCRLLSNIAWNVR